MNKYRLKFLLFLVFIIVLIAILVWFEGHRNHPNYAPMFSNLGQQLRALRIPVELLTPGENRALTV